MKKNKCKLNKRGKFAIYAFILLVILFIYICISSSIFELKQIDVDGNSKITKSDIIKIGDIETGKNIFKYNLNDVEKKLLVNPYIKYVKVSRKFPDKLVITIKENSEYAIIKEGASYIYIGENGLVLSEKKDIKNKNIPLVSGIEIKNKKLNTKIKINSDKSNDIILAIDTLKNNNMSRKIESIKINKNKMYMKTDDNTNIVLKIDEDIEYNINRLKAILVDLKSNNKKGGNIDLTSKEQAIYSP
ncbi:MULTISPECIES: cell division protein FtsQ/DivIB [Paraclostridium]|uniref:FtsQ-type POTRA domain-containing protein n=1 Tax=Paraclostridium bifermentans TaxID=1490 RepID=A0AA44IFL9_PARBF|nr:MULTISPECIES: FtsQ-type POTRA domain-containing protein [Paraclostridium]MBN8048464.1 FtsQ-type POTRA domain-containing protein [Paraclostridium bifermentans]MBZ6006552.1 FtsQ-type POTRA domain-containing protein [Paraclostridium bifermentans]MDU0297568.1 FtsQ-type POTRA domain-containing protein [Paraclostridium sp. MRS3W1]NME07942.1 FtsQ-type POTRA domain-containing protein [Paraclostridium bifermentans]